MIEYLTLIEQSGIASALRTSRWVYPLVNASHILGIAILVGSIIAFDLKVLGVVGAKTSLNEMRSVLLPVSAVGFVLATITGAFLFSVKAVEYGGNPAFLIKIALVLLALANIVFLRLTGDRPRLHAFLSLAFWIAAIFAGRWIAFV